MGPERATDDARTTPAQNWKNPSIWCLRKLMWQSESSLGSFQPQSLFPRKRHSFFWKVEKEIRNSPPTGGGMSHPPVDCYLSNKPSWNGGGSPVHFYSLVHGLLQVQITGK
eukprot:scaffold22345_cov43-Attheya_sp.AAC.2